MTGLIGRAGTSLVLLLSLLPLAEASAQEPPESRYFDSEGVRLHYIDEGSGEPVLLIHGLAVNVELNWIQPGVASALREGGYRVIAYDSRGHGRSDKPYDPPAYGTAEVDDVVRLLDHLGISRAHVVGYSRGGRVAHRVRARHPERVRTVTLGGYGETPDREGPPFPAGELADSLEAGRFAFLVRNIDPEAPAEEVEAIAGKLSEMNDGRAVAAAFRADTAFSRVTQDALSQNEVPTLALIGEHDGFGDQVRRMSEVMTNLEVLVIPGADHVSAFQRPEFLTGLFGFLSRHPIDVVDDQRE